MIVQWQWYIIKGTWIINKHLSMGEKPWFWEVFLIKMEAGTWIRFRTRTSMRFESGSNSISGPRTKREAPKRIWVGVYC